MQKSGLKPKKGTPNSRTRSAGYQSNNKVKKYSYSSNGQSIEVSKIPKPDSLLCRIGPLCECDAKPIKEFIRVPECLKLTTPKKILHIVTADNKVSAESQTTYIKNFDLSDVKESGTCSSSKDDESFDFYQCEHSILTEIEEVTAETVAVEDSPLCDYSTDEKKSTIFKKTVFPWKIYKVSIKCDLYISQVKTFARTSVGTVRLTLQFILNQ